MKNTLRQMLDAHKELSGNQEPLPGFLAKFTKPLTIIGNWADSVTDLCKQFCQHSESATERLEELEQRLAQVEQNAVGQIRDFVEANQ